MLPPTQSSMRLGSQVPRTRQCSSRALRKGKEITRLTLANFSLPFAHCSATQGGDGGEQVWLPGTLRICRDSRRTWPQYAGQYGNGQAAYPQQPYQQPIAYGHQQQHAAPYAYGQPQQQVYTPAVTFTSTYTPTYPQPQYAGTSLSPQMHISPNYPSQDSPANLPAQPAASSAEAVPPFLLQLIGAGLIPAGRNPNPAGLSGSASGAPSAASFEIMKSKVRLTAVAVRPLFGRRFAQSSLLHWPSFLGKGEPQSAAQWMTSLEARPGICILAVCSAYVKPYTVPYSSSPPS